MKIRASGEPPAEDPGQKETCLPIVMITIIITLALVRFAGF